MFFDCILKNTILDDPVRIIHSINRLSVPPSMTNLVCPLDQDDNSLERRGSLGQDDNSSKEEDLTVGRGNDDEYLSAEATDFNDSFRGSTS